MKVLLAVDPSSGSQSVVSEAAARPWPTGTAICVLSIVDSAHLEGLPQLIEDAQRTAQVLIEAATDRLEGPGRQVFSDIQLGNPKQAIEDFARDWQSDLVMAGSRGLGSFSRFFLGSVAQAVLRTVPCSVEIVRPTPPGEPASSRALKILLATDGSKYSEIAATSVADRPWPAGSQIKVISVRDLLDLENPTNAFSPCPVYPESLLSEILNDSRQRAEEAVSRARNILRSKGMKVCEGQYIPVGDARAVLLDEASAWGADLIVLGSHGRHGFDRFALGSVSESVALHAHCSVEVIRGGR
ncbi:MAG: universal stress protein [Terriglobales bacterium]